MQKMLTDGPVFGCLDAILGTINYIRFSLKDKNIHNAYVYRSGDFWL